MKKGLPNSVLDAIILCSLRGDIVVDVIAEVCAGREFDSRRLQKYTTVCGRKTDFVGVSDVATHAAEFYGVLLKGA